MGPSSSQLAEPLFTGSPMLKALTRPSSFWHPIRRRRFDSALAVLLGLHLFRRLSAEDQALVENLLIENCRKWSSCPYTVLLNNLGTSSDFIAALRAGAMSKLGMPTGVEGLPWSEFLHPSWQGLTVQTTFRRFDAATEDAAEFLRANGLVLDEDNGHAKNWMDAMRVRYP